MPNFKKILITGASSGIGEAAAHAFSNLGCELFLVARRSDRLDEVAAECERRGAARTVCKQADLSVSGAGATIVDECLGAFGGLEVAICNAGYGIMGPVFEVPPADMSRIWQVNFQSAYETIHAALPHLIGQKRGHIVMVSSVLGKKAMPFSAAYSVTKFAQVALGESLWGELRGSGVGVSVICPGYTATEFHQAAKRTGSMAKLSRPFQGQSSEHVAEVIVRAVLRGKREVHLTFPGRMICGIERLAPGLSTRIMAWVGAKQKNRSETSGEIN